jgi:hypothetical protein
VGLVIRRLVAKCFAASTSEHAVEILSPLQVGMGIKKGCEALVHGTRALLREGKKHSLQVDFQNAFNLTDRQLGLRAVEVSFPQMIRWVETCYKHKARVPPGRPNRRTPVIPCPAPYLGDHPGRGA